MTDLRPSNPCNRPMQHFTMMSTNVLSHVYSYPGAYVAHGPQVGHAWNLVSTPCSYPQHLLPSTA